MKRQKITIGSRGSSLAMIYAENVKAKLKEVFSKEIEIKKIVTTGDENQKDRLSNLGGKGLFSKKIEDELLENNIDIAVHALKDMPSIETDGLETNYFLKRNSPNEILLSNKKIKFNDLKPNSIVGTSSYRREYQLKNKRTDLCPDFTIFERSSKCLLPLFVIESGNSAKPFSLIKVTLFISK